MDIDTLLKPLGEEQQYFQKLQQSTSVELILENLLNLLQPDDYRQLFYSNTTQSFDFSWLKSFSKLCMKRYLEYDDPCFSSNDSKIDSTNSIIGNYKQFLIRLLKLRFKIPYFHAILTELQCLNRFKIEQITAQLKANNHLIEQIHLLLDLKDDADSTKDDGIIHLSSTPAQTSARPIYLNYKPNHMIYLRDQLLINNHADKRLPSRGVTNVFVADLINTKTINILDETTGKTFDIPTKWLYFAKPCDSNVLLPLKLRVLTIDNATGRRRYGLIGEEAGKSNDYRCLVFFTDDSENAAACYHLSSHLHICLDQTYATHSLENPSDFLERYFNSYPERMMLRAKEGIIVKVRNIFSTNQRNSSTFLPALVIQIDGSMMQIEFSHSKQRLWLYRGSPLLDQMHNYYSTQNRTVMNGLTRQTARQHLSARRTNVPELICLNEQNNRTKLVRPAEQTVDETRSFKRPRTTSEQELHESSTVNEPRTLRSNQNNSPSTSSLPTLTVTQLVQQSSVQSRSNQANTNSRIVMNPLFLELAENFLFHYVNDFHAHECSHRCVAFAEKNYHQLPRTMNPFLKPFACYWTILENVRIRKVGDFRLKATGATIIYCAPCGRKLISLAQIDTYLLQTKSKLTIELFVFDKRINVKQHYLPDGKILNSDISNGLENVPISVVNEIDKEPNHIEEPSAFTYRVERSPVPGVQMIINEPSMTCCTCTDECRDRSKCACWLRTLKYSELIGDERLKILKRKNRTLSQILDELGYRHRRLLKNVPGGIFECNSRCSCKKQTCSNRVVQNGIVAQLQLFKTARRGWGVRTLHDLPTGTFISVYSGEIFTSEQADERGKLLGDEYQADLDFFENINHDSEEEQTTANPSLEPDENEDSLPSSTDSTNPRQRNSNSQGRERDSSNKKENKKLSKSTSDNDDDEGYSILNRTSGLPDYDGVVYTLDAKLIGNIGRYFNHSCSPNIAVQNVFVDTHDIHFPWIGFFATKMIRAGSELCWDYNYTVGEIAGRRMDCHCGSADCRRRVL